MNELFKKIAEENNTTEKKVRKEIEKAIQMGMSNPDPKVQAFWNLIPRKGNSPTPEEVVYYLTKSINDRNNR